MMVIKKRKRFSIHNEYLVFFFFCIDLTPSYHIPPAGGMACFEQVFFFLSSSAAWIIGLCLSINHGYRAIYIHTWSGISLPPHCHKHGCFIMTYVCVYYIYQWQLWVYIDQVVKWYRFQNDKLILLLLLLLKKKSALISRNQSAKLPPLSHVPS